MKIRLAESHCFPSSLIEEIEKAIYEKEMTAEEVLHFLSQYICVVSKIVDGVVVIYHPYARA